jgi:hypothetical protein
MQAIPSLVRAAQLGARPVFIASEPQQAPSCKPATDAPRLRVYAGRDAAALMGTRPVSSGGEGARTPQREVSAQVVASPELRREVSGNLKRLFYYRDMFGDEFVGRQCWVCLKLLGGLGAAF